MLELGRLRIEGPKHTGDDMRIRTSGTPQLAGQLILGGLVVYDTGPNFKLLGDARNGNLSRRIAEAKGDYADRVTAAVPFDSKILENAIYTNNIDDPDIREFLANPDIMTGRLGGIAILKVPANPEAKRKNRIPDSILPKPEHKGWTSMRLYSPVGNAFSEQVMGHVIKNGGIPALSKLSHIGQPEVVDLDHAQQHANLMELRLIYEKDNDERPWQPRGAYPVIEPQYDTATQQWILNVLQPGFLEMDVIARLLDAFPVAQLDPTVTSKHHDNILGFDGLPTGAQSASGPELRKYILEKMQIDH